MSWGWFALGAALMAAAYLEGARRVFGRWLRRKRPGAALTPLPAPPTAAPRPPGRAELNQAFVEVQLALSDQYLTEESRLDL